MHNLIYLLLVSFIVSSLTACSSSGSLNDTFAGRKVDYKKQSRTIKRLVVPPEMISERMSDFMVVTNLASEVEKGNHILDSKDTLVTVKQVEYKNEDNIRFLKIHDTKKNVWDKVRKFWISKGFKVTRETPALGILETDWLENKADLPQDLITRNLSKVLGGLYSTGSRDKYRVRLEETESSQLVRLYLTHYSMVEKDIKGPETELVRWKKGQRDPELEAEMLGQIMLYFGLEEQKIKKILAQKQQEQTEKASLIINDSGNQSVLIKEPFPRAWRKMSVVLDRLDFIIEDRNRDKGLFYLQYALPKNTDEDSFFAGLSFWGNDDNKKKPYRIKLIPQGENTLVSIFDDNMKEISGEVLEQINAVLHENLK